MILPVLTAALLICGCKKIFPQGPAVREQRTVTAFTKIEAAFSGNVEFIQGPARSIEVEAAPNIQHYILTEVSDGRLVLKTQPNINIRKGHVTIYISNPDLEEAVLSGSGNFVANAGINCPSLDLRISGSGHIYLAQLQSAAITAGISGSGDISIAGGVATDQDITVTGNGSCDTHQLRTAKTHVQLAGSGDAKVWVDEVLEVLISGSGDVWYQGNPTINTSISGSGKVRKI